MAACVAGFRLVTWRFWALVVGVVTPLFPVVIHTYVVAQRILAEGDTVVSPLYPTVLSLMLGSPPLLLVGFILSYALRRPQAAGTRFLLGFAIGAALIAIAVTGAIHF